MKGEIRSQTGLRGVAAITVALGHLPFENFFPNSVLTLRKYLFGPQAVDLFFFLSGYIMAYVYIKADGAMRSSWRDFYVARFARIYPVHLITFLIIGAFAWLSARIIHIDMENYLPWHFFSQFFLVNAWPFVGMEWAWNYPSWSVSVEFFCYLLVFPVWVGCSRFVGVREGSVAIFLQVASLIVILSNLPLDDTYGWPALYRGVVGFSSGCIIFKLGSSERFTGIRDFFVRNATWVFLAAIIVLILGAEGVVSKWLLIGVYPFVMLAVSRDGDGLAHSFLKYKITHWLGVISYSIYMWHAFFSKSISTLFRSFDLHLGSVERCWLGVIMILGLLMFSQLSYTFLEVPMRNMIRRKLSD